MSRQPIQRFAMIVSLTISTNDNLHGLDDSNKNTGYQGRNAAAWPENKKMHNVDLSAMQMACRILARQTYGSEQSSPELAIAELAEGFVQIAHEQAIIVIESGRDPNIVVRAITYLAYTHVIPSSIDAKWWFVEMLSCLLELAVPSMIQTPESSAFLQDIQEGIAEWTGPT